MICGRDENGWICVVLFVENAQMLAIVCILR